MKTDRAEEHKEGEVAKTIEHETAKLPSDWFLWAAGASMVASLVLKMNNKNHGSEFVGLWAPSLLLLGVYNKLVKVMGSDQTEQRPGYARSTTY